MEAGGRVVGVNGSADERRRRSELLQVRGVFKSFGGTEALADVGMSLKAGEILALLGENGAGKSTLIKILAGVYPLDAGSVSFRSVDVTHALRRLPIAFIHQDLGLIDWMTVAENICMTLGFPRRLGMIDRDAARRRAAVALDALGADIDPDTRIQNLSRTEKSLVAIARALAAEPEILVLDEPTASLPADEVARLFSALRRLRARGVAMIYVSHRLDEVFEIADRMIVLRDGRVAGEREVAKTTPDETILLIVGASHRRSSAGRPNAMARRGLPCSRSWWRRSDPSNARSTPAKSSAWSGCGRGQESVGRALFGVSPMTGGRVLLDGRHVAVSSPREAMARGINLVCADRVGKSIMPNLSVRENLFLNPVAAGLSLFSFLSPGRENRAARERGAQVGLRPNDPTLPIEFLSGGNQQKVAVGRWLHLDAKIYVFEDPTAGVDVGPRPKSIACSTSRSRQGRRSSSDRPISRRWQRSPPGADLQSGPGGRGAGRRDLSVKICLPAASASVRRSEPLLGNSSSGFGGAHAVH